MDGLGQLFIRQSLLPVGVEVEAHGLGAAAGRAHHRNGAVGGGAAGGGFGRGGGVGAGVGLHAGPGGVVLVEGG